MDFQCSPPLKKMMPLMMVTRKGVKTFLGMDELMILHQIQLREEKMLLVVLLTARMMDVRKLERDTLVKNCR